MVFTFRKRTRWPRVLEWVNEKRRVLGLESLVELKKGDHSASGCPIANSLRNGGSAQVATYRSTVTSKDGATLQWDHPDFVERFIRNFDEGKFPELKG